MARRNSSYKHAQVVDEDPSTRHSAQEGGSTFQSFKKMHAPLVYLGVMQMYIATFHSTAGLIGLASI